MRHSNYRQFRGGIHPALLKEKQEALVQSKNPKRINDVTEETEAPVFDLLENGLGLGAINVTDAL